MVCRRNVLFGARSLLTSLIALSAMVSTPLMAQDTAPVEEWRSQWSAAIGLDPFAPKRSTPLSDNFVAAIGREWSRSGSGLGFRAQVSTGAIPTTRLSLGASCGECFISTQRRFVELSGAATYTFRRSSSFRPYVLGGPALYGVRHKYSVTGAVLGDPQQNMGTVYALGATIGAGFHLRVLGQDLFLEQRAGFTEMSSGNQGVVIHPFTLGIRF